MDWWDLRTKSEIERDRKTAWQYIAFILCIIAVIYILFNGTC